ncbi:hypothetical protein, variant 2 [Aphanomyces astaci]|nr:hypothetical protein, variant 2 [Aphanomyces astaci]ETV66531.1 hypothetical protein, variant 2 [Aphanomyces astaci]|eukprot:XP_009843902.1 hypothetical protein, variant 2 [Aphanomyces astaci]
MIRLGCLPVGDWLYCKHATSFQFQIHRKRQDKYNPSHCGTNVSSKASKCTSGASQNSLSSTNKAIAKPSSKSSTTAPERKLQSKAGRPSTSGHSLSSHHHRPITSRSIQSNQSEHFVASNDSGSAASTNPRDVLEQVKKAILARGGANGIQGISRMMRIMDDSGDKRLSRDEFKFGLRDYGVDCSDSDVDSLLRAFDTDGDGFISFDEFLVALRGDISPRRLRFIDMAFQKLDKSKDGRVTIDDLRTVYDVSKHPEFIQGKQTADQILSEFLRQWDTVDHDGVVTYDEFVTYYRSVSASIDTDDYFELMMRNAWHLSGGDGQCANSSIKRVLVTHPDGHQSVEQVDETEKSPELELCRERDFVKYCSLLLFTPPCTVDVLAQKLGANRVLGNGQERIHVKVLAKVLSHLDKSLSSRQAQVIANSFDTCGTQLLHIPSMHQTLARRFGTRHEPAKSIMDKLKFKLCASNPSGGILGLQRVLRDWDTSGDGWLSKDELKKGLDQCKVDLNLQQVDHLMTLLDTDKRGGIRIDDLLTALRGELSGPRLALVRQLHANLEAKCKGNVMLADLKLHFNPSRQRSVVQGKLTERQAVVEFLAQWDGSIDNSNQKKERVVTVQDLAAYYANIGASIDGDDEFHQLLRDSWHVQTAQPTNTRPQTNAKLSTKNTHRAGGEGVSSAISARRGTPPIGSATSNPVKTLAEREHALVTMKSMRDKAALVVQSKFRCHKARVIVDCVKRTQAAQAARRQEVADDARKGKPRVSRPALNSYHGF